MFKLLPITTTYKVATSLTAFMFKLLPITTTYKVATSLTPSAADIVDDILFGFPSVRRKMIVCSFATSGRPLFVSSVFAIVNAAAVSVFQCGQLIPSTAAIKADWSVVIG